MATTGTFNFGTGQFDIPSFLANIQGGGQSGAGLPLNGWSPVQYDPGTTGYNPTGIGPVSNLVNQATNRYMGALNNPNFGGGFENQALSRGLGYAPYFSQGLPAQTLRTGMTAPGYYGFGPQAQSLKFLQQSAPYVQSNPYLQSAMMAANIPAIQQFQEAIMPSIGDAFSQNGVTGSSRQGIAEGIAARGLAQTIANNNAQMASQGYTQGLNAMMQGLNMGQGDYQNALSRQLTAGQIGSSDYENALNRQLNAYNIGSNSDLNAAKAQLALLSGAGGIADLNMYPSSVMQQLGGQRQQQTQQAITDAMNRWNYYQNLPAQQLDTYARLIGGIPLGGAGTTTQQAPSSLLGNVTGALGSIGGLVNAGTALSSAMGGPSTLAGLLSFL